MNLEKKAVLEGILFGAVQPLKAETLATLLEVEPDEIKNALGELQEDYAKDNRGIYLTLVAGGYQLRTKPELKATMAKLFEKKPPRLSQAMLETLAIVAYKQPVTRPEIDRVRGVDSSGALKTLLERGLVEMRGRSESVGNPVLYATTSKFLEWFQIGSLGDLPPLAEFEALQEMSDEASENLMNLLNQDEGFSAEDLREMDSELSALNRQQKQIKENIEGPEDKEQDAEADPALSTSEQSQDRPEVQSGS